MQPDLSTSVDDTALARRACSASGFPVKAFAHSVRTETRCRVVVDDYDKDTAKAHLIATGWRIASAKPWITPHYDLFEIIAVK